MQNDLHIELGSELSAEFADRLLASQDSGRLPSGVTVGVGASRRMPGGFAMAVPHEVIIAVGTAVATTLASEIVKTLWAELRDFLKGKDEEKKETPIVIVIGGERHEISRASLQADPPPALVQKLAPAS